MHTYIHSLFPKKCTHTLSLSVCINMHSHAHVYMHTYTHNLCTNTKAMEAFSSCPSLVRSHSIHTYHVYVHVVMYAHAGIKSMHMQVCYSQWSADARAPTGKIKSCKLQHVMCYTTPSKKKHDVHGISIKKRKPLLKIFLTAIDCKHQRLPIDCRSASLSSSSSSCHGLCLCYSHEKY